MNEEPSEALVSSWEELHPWLAVKAADEENDSLDEVIRYTLDEIRFT